MRIVILDTNIVLDLFLFRDPRTGTLGEYLGAKQLTWLATPHMRNELERVLTYPHIAAKLIYYKKTSENILAAFDRTAQITEPPVAKAPYTCKDTDDQAFIDLACHLASQRGSAPLQLISKDKAILCMRKRLEKLTIHVTSSLKVTEAS